MTEPVQEIDLMAGVDQHPWGPTEPDEQAVLDRLFDYDTVRGVYGFYAGSLLPGTVAATLNRAQQYVGVHGRPNAFTREYAEVHGAAFLTAPWCDMFITYVAHHTPSLQLIPAGDRAYTPYHAADFVTRHRFHPGTAANVRRYAVPGAILFDDWNGTDTPANVDHVGLVIKNLGDGRCATVEGNTSDSVALRVRGADVIATIAVPVYTIPVTPPAPVPAPLPSAWPYKAGTLMRKGWVHSAGVKRVQARLNTLGYPPKLQVDGDYGTKTQARVRAFQHAAHLITDGVVGPLTWARLFPAVA